MKLVALWLATLTLAAVTAASCSVNHRSGDFSCQTSSDCADGRLCVDNLCVSNAPIDGGTNNPIDGGAMGTCPAACTSCDPTTKACKIDCALSNGCKFPVTCPGGWNCDIECNTDGSCNSGVVCADRQCQIECGGRNSCRNLACGTGACTIDCLGPDSCRTIQGGSGKQTVNCQAPGACNGVSCGSGNCNVSCTDSATCNKVTCGSGRCNVECSGSGSCATASCGAACACDIDCQFGSICDPLICSHSNKCTDNFGDCVSDTSACNTCPGGM